MLCVNYLSPLPLSPLPLSPLPLSPLPRSPLPRSPLPPLDPLSLPGINVSSRCPPTLHTKLANFELVLSAIIVVENAMYLIRTHCSDNTRLAAHIASLSELEGSDIEATV